MQNRQDRRNFIITCHGWSASNWLAHALNMHKDIVCTHSARNVTADKKDLQSNFELRKNLKSLHHGYVSRQNQSLDTVFNHIESQGTATSYGSVHVHRLRDLPVLDKKFGTPERNFSVMNLVRHPVDLVWSGYGQFRDLFLYDINEMYWTLGKIVDDALEFVNNIADRYNLQVGALDNLAFIGAAAVLVSLKKDADALEQVKELPYVDFKGFVKMEEVTTRPPVLAELVGRITSVDNPWEESYLNDVYKLGRINKHKADSKKISPAQRFGEMLPWQQEVFTYFWQKYRLQSLYEGIGYDMSFINNP